ncbi:MAG: DUF262 domain-containing protein [Candidatus Roizmanbacteria bacterium]|nr:DUF262 domain-containing protein [Candidatus Roizmanbacteria bacterium]
MPSFNPKTRYDIVQKDFQIRDFHAYKDEFVTRPPYQRKNVWSRKKQQDLLDSMFRRFYIPRIVIREVRLREDQTINEVIDGQQRIITAQNFLNNKLQLPKSLNDIHPGLPGKTYSDLPAEVRRFVDRELIYTADVVKNIENPRNPEHQRIATEIFWRLQQGENLTFMEIAHSRLSSLARNFLVKYADDQTFDYDSYVPIDNNPHKHPFFTVITRNNDRMQHLALLARLVILEEKWEENNGPCDIRDQQIMEYIDEYQREDGIGNYSFENLPFAKRVVSHINKFYEVFKDDPMVDENGGMREFSIEYFIISIYLLLRHIDTYYVFDKKEKKLFREFAIAFHNRWKSERDESDTDILYFSESRQMSAKEIAFRDRIIRQVFFEYAKAQGHQMLTKDERRAFNEAERIQIYRRDNGLCQICLEEGKPEIEARVPWSEYDADHVLPHSKGGSTSFENAQVLCRYHNQQKGNKLN